LPGSTGTITLTGNGATLTSFGALSVGGYSVSAGGQGTLTINSGTTVNSTSGGLNLWAPGTINLQGGTLNVQTFHFNGGTVTFNSGTVNFSLGATLGNAELSALMGPSQTLNSGQTLSNTTGTLTLNDNLMVNGGKLQAANLSNWAVLQVNAGTTNISGGSGL